MKKVFNILLIVAVIVVVIIIGLYIAFIIIVSPPRVKRSEKKVVTPFAEDYLTKKYGNHNFKVTKISYYTHSSTLFNYECIGYEVRFKSDVVKDSYIIILGLIPSNFSVKSDGFIHDYYYPDLNGADRYEIFSKMVPNNKIESELLKKFEQEFRTECEDLKCSSTLSIPDDLGRIPTLDELKNESKYYKILSFSYLPKESIEESDKEEYTNKLSKFLSKTLGDKWNIYISNYVSCFRESDNQ